MVALWMGLVTTAEVAPRLVSSHGLVDGATNAHGVRRIRPGTRLGTAESATGMTGKAP